MGFAAPAGLVLALLEEFLSYIIIASLLIIWTYTFGKILLYLADHLDFDIDTHIAGKIPVHLGYPFRVANKAVHGWLADNVRGLEIEMGWTWHALQAVWASTAHAVEALLHETDATFDWLTDVHLPKWAKWIAKAALPGALLAKLIAEAVAHLRPVVTKTARTIERTLPFRLTPKILHAIEGALPNPLAFPKFRRTWRELEAWRKATEKRLRLLEALLAASGLALAVAKMTGTTFKCWRPGGNIHRAMRRFCGLDKWLVDLLLLGSVEAFVVGDLCEFTALLTRATQFQVPALMELVDVEDALIGCHGASKPVVINLPPATPTPLQGISPLAA